MEIIVSIFDQNRYVLQIWQIFGHTALRIVFRLELAIFSILNLKSLFQPKCLSTSDEPELEFSGSSRAKLGKFQAEPSWGTLIFERKPTWKFWQYVCQ